jgi:hypothetical protein
MNGDVQEFGATVLKFVLCVGIGSVLLCLASSGDWALVATAAPLAIFLVPGYFELLPRGDKRHKVNCDCAKFDAKCEWGFWCGYGQKGFLIFPVAITIIFINGYLNRGLATAIADTCMATFTIIVFSLVTAVAFFTLSRMNKT